jgi:molecular chaperone DnaK (HSP70)
MAKLVGIDLGTTYSVAAIPPYFYLGVINEEREHRKEKRKAIEI